MPDSPAENDSSLVVAGARSRPAHPAHRRPRARRARRALLARGTDLRADVLKIPHHGSARQDPAFFAATGARLAIASAGRDNDYGHPAPRTVQLARSLRDDGAAHRRAGLGRRHRPGRPAGRGHRAMTTSASERSLSSIGGAPLAIGGAMSGRRLRSAKSDDGASSPGATGARQQDQTRSCRSADRATGPAGAAEEHLRDGLALLGDVAPARVVTGRDRGEADGQAVVAGAPPDLADRR